MDKTLIENPLVSVIMPVFNGERFLSEAILSILNQSYSNLELIIINDGSVDKSEDIIFKYKKKDKRIKYFKNKRNLGISRSLNKAIGLATGKYIARMDCDDVSLPERINKEVIVMERNKNVAICGTWGKAIDESGNDLFLMKSPTGLFLKYNYWKPFPFISSSVMIRKDVINMYRFRRKFDTVEDYDTWIRILMRFDGFNINQILILYRINLMGVSRQNPLRQIEKSMHSLVENLGIKNISMDAYLSLICTEYKLNTFARMRILYDLRKKIYYPIWFLMVDSGYYFYRKILFKYFPKLKKY